MEIALAEFESAREFFGEGGDGFLLGDGGQSWGDFPFGEAHREGAGIGAGVDLVFE